MEITKKTKEPMFDLIDQLKHVCVKISLFQAIKMPPSIARLSKRLV